MPSLRDLLRPHYLLRPALLVRRVTPGLRRTRQDKIVRLPWRHEIVVDPRDWVGQFVMRWGVYDLVVCEVLLRLTDPGETAIDAGANIGQMTSLLAHAVGSTGRVISFEPHPTTFARLSHNATQWDSSSGGTVLELHQAALSSAAGTASLATAAYEINAGSASLEPLSQERAAVDRHEVAVETLDAVLGAEGRIGVMKVDVEGHEASLFEGGRSALESHRIRDILFEEHREPPTPVTEMLLACGYALMRVDERFRGPVAGSLDDKHISSRGERSLLATVDPERARERLGPRGWAVYGIGPVSARRRTP
jgi:FkbM family methyltransferase